MRRDAAEAACVHAQCKCSVEDTDCTHFFVTKLHPSWQNISHMMQVMMMSDDEDRDANKESPQAVQALRCTRLTHQYQHFTAGNGWDNHQGNFSDTGVYDPRQMPGFWNQGQQQVSQGALPENFQPHGGSNVEVWACAGQM